MIEIRAEFPHDVPARERLLDVCFPGNRRAKTSERLREGRLPARGPRLRRDAPRSARRHPSPVACRGGRGGPALLLGPLAVDPAVQGQGLGSVMMQAAIGRAEALGHGAILLMGDAPYYARFGFRAISPPGSPCRARSSAPGSWASNCVRGRWRAQGTGRPVCEPMPARRRNGRARPRLIRPLPRPDEHLRHASEAKQPRAADVLGVAQSLDCFAALQRRRSFFGGGGSAGARRAIILPCPTPRPPAASSP